MRLFHHPMSANARRAVMAAHQLGAPVELVLVDLGKGAQRQPDFLRMNPNGKVPVLEDEGFFLTESHAIMLHLARKTPGQTLYPEDLRARADVERWLFWNAHHFAPAIAVLNWENLVKPMVYGGAPDAGELARGATLIAQTAGVLDAHLAGKEWVVEGRLTLADLALATPLMSTVPAKLPVTQYQNLQAWFGRVRALEAWKKTDL